MESMRETYIPIVPYMYLYAFLRSQKKIPRMDDDDTSKLQSYVRWRIFDQSAENKTTLEVMEKARLLALMKRNVAFKRFQIDVWDEYER